MTSATASPGPPASTSTAGPPSAPASGRAVTLAVLVAALGYFVDIYDLILFSVVRVRSLESLGLRGDEVLRQGIHILDMQMIGMLAGGILWGVWGDRRGRLSVLFGSIALYSLANIANGAVEPLAGMLGLRPVDLYAWIRLIAGVGLAGELGAGITLVSESMGRHARGWGTTVVASVGVCGAVAAVLVAKAVDWRIAYYVGGGMGLGLLALRVGVIESGMYQHLRGARASRANVALLFNRIDRLRRYACIILVGVPIWYVIGILISLAPELGRSLGMSPAPAAPNAVLAAYVGLAVGDFGSGFLSQVLRSRRRILGGFILATAGGVVLYFTVGPRTLTGFYAICGLLGVAAGYWAVFVSTASELFGTNIRATVTTTAPNFVRGSLVPVTAIFLACKASLGVAGSAIAVGVGVLALALLALAGLPETFGKDLDYVEGEDGG